MEKLKASLFWAIALSETMHVFCCVLPTLISIASLLAGVGVLSVLPGPLLVFHDLMHHWEIPMILLSAAILALGWLLHIISSRIDCHSTGCAHEPCRPRKNSTALILWIATALFTVNTLIYILLHAR